MAILPFLLISNHDWEQVGENCNIPARHVWRCTKCKEWTRSGTKPEPNAQLSDPDTGARYTAPQCK